jgi:hypothetical protein
MFSVPNCEKIFSAFAKSAPAMQKVADGITPDTPLGQIDQDVIGVLNRGQGQIPVYRK